MSEANYIWTIITMEWKQLEKTYEEASHSIKLRGILSMDDPRLRAKLKISPLHEL